jgi:hypothetical protein
MNNRLKKNRKYVDELTNRTTSPTRRSLFQRAQLENKTFVTAGPSARSSGKIVGSNPAQDMDICLFWVLCIVT